MTNDTTGTFISFAGIGKRFVASLVDSIIILAALGLIAVVALDLSLTSYIILFLLMFFGQWVYFAWMESTSGATLGKKVMQVRVVDLEGNPVSFARASGRYFGKYLSAILMIGYIMAFFTEKKQALHDLLAGTLVVDNVPVPQAGSQELPIEPETQPVSLDLNPLDETKPVDPGLDDFGTPQAAPTVRRDVAPQPAPASKEEGKNAPVVPPGSKTCPSCGTAVGKFQTKCHHCGAKLKKG
jgi:uncharacterized RDD family membrane protein YckC